MKVQVAVIDIGSFDINVYIAEKGINNTFNIKGQVSSRYSGFINGKFVEISSLRESINHCIKNIKDVSKEKIKKVYVSVPAEFSTIKVIEVSQSFGKTKKLTQNDVLNLIDDAYDIKSDNINVKQNVAPIYYELDDKRRVLDIDTGGHYSSNLKAKLSFAYVKKQFITILSDTLRKLSIYDVEFICSPLATCKYLFGHENRNTEKILIDIGFLTTSVSLSKGEGLLSLNSFSLGGGYITGDLSEGLEIEFEQAEKLKKQIVLSLDVNENDLYELKLKGKTRPISAETANKIVEGRLEMIVEYINKILVNYENNNQKIYLTGGGVSYLKGSKDYISKLMGRNIEIISPHLVQMDMPHYSSLVGLINAAIDEESALLTNNLYDKIKRITNKIKVLFGGKND